MSSRISLRTDITEDSAASNSSTSQDTDVDWGAKIMENIHVIAAQEQGEEVVWPGYTLIRFFEVMEKIQRKEEEVVRLRTTKPSQKLGDEGATVSIQMKNRA
ncbi:hypothetical protein NFI96_032256, partial [Prochilodus magdalenae]